MKRFPELARRGVALALAASMSLSVFMPGALAADLTTAEEHDHDHVHLAAENSVDALGNEDLSDETDTALDEAADAADHVWGEWQVNVDDEGISETYRICNECGAVELEDGTIIPPETEEDVLDVVEDDQPEWLTQGKLFGTASYISEIAVYASVYDDPGYGLKADGTWNYAADYAHWTKVTNTQYSTSIDTRGKRHFNHTPELWGERTNSADWDRKITCAGGGQIEYRCTKKGCNKAFTKKFNAPGHTTGLKYHTDATCTKPGVDYTYCGRDNSVTGCGDLCTYIFPNTTVITPATGHHTGGEKWIEGDESTVGWVTEPATCTTPGRRYRKCDTEGCGFVEEDKDYAKAHPATGHKNAAGDVWYDNDPATAEIGWTVDKKETCGTAGSRHRTCVNENCPLDDNTETEEIQPTGKHTYKFASTTQPYHCQPGKETWKCSVCGETEERDAKVADHTPGDWEITVNPTCTTTGTRVKKCTVCGNVVETETIDALGHEYLEKNYVDEGRPGCCDQYARVKCTRCDSTIEVKTSGPVRAHKYSRYVSVMEKQWKELWVGGIKIGSGWVDVAVTKSTCDYEGCNAEDKMETLIYSEYSTEALAATEAARQVSFEGRDIVLNALKSTYAAVEKAQTREEAIAALDEIYNSALHDLMNITVKVDNWSVPISVSKEVAESMLKEVKTTIENMKNMLNGTFLSMDAIKTIVKKVSETANDTASGVQESIKQMAFFPIYAQLSPKRAEAKDPYDDEMGNMTSALILKLAQNAVDNPDCWQELLDAIFDDLIDMLIEQLKKDPEYSKYLNNALGDELLEELRPKLREELVNDTTFVDTIRGIASNAIRNAASGVNKGWSDAKVLKNLREDLLKVQDPVEQEMLDLSATIGDLVESSLAEKINKFLPFGDLTSWIGKWVGAFAKDKAVSEVVGETGKVRQTIEMYIKYITCGKHDPQTRIAQQASCTDNEMTERYCSKCGWVFEKYKTGDAWGHTPVTVKGYEATETADGLTDGVQCSVCGTWIEPQEVIPAEEPQYEKYLVKSAVTADTAKAAGYKNQKKLDEAIDAALTKAGYQTANSERFLAQVQTSIGILSNDRYPEDGVTGMVKLPAGAAGKNCTFYAVQVLTADTHGYSAGDVVVTPLTVTSEGISFKLPVQSVVAIAWKVNE